MTGCLRRRESRPSSRRWRWNEHYKRWRTCSWNTNI